MTTEEAQMEGATRQVTTERFPLRLARIHSIATDCSPCCPRRRGDNPQEDLQLAGRCGAGERDYRYGARLWLGLKRKGGGVFPGRGTKFLGRHPSRLGGELCLEW